ncbi:hypothetical protein B0F90DRAFT_882144 [Multifurca ochricompacta]|uniref:Uncharacterized protein n=1 Tax=Multifurca ochricompacta TaxID=376703 RepID=A0AAD4QJB2_9AGAM|nr:hypothetical protein B0F90DRAFT_882144 [Multifurca ochricompacta]
MPNDCSVKTPLSLLPWTRHSLTPAEGAAALIFPDLHLCAENMSRDDDDAPGIPSTTTVRVRVRESAASSFTPPNPSSSRTPSPEPTESTTSSFEPSSSSSFSSSSSSSSISLSTFSTPLLPDSPTRVPARLRRKCPIYVQEQAQAQKMREGDGDGDGDGGSVDDDLAPCITPLLRRG